MRRFSSWLAESQKLPYDKHRKIGWWKDGEKDHLVLYHGTHEAHLHSVLKHGIDRKDPKTGMISTTPDPNTAHGYAAMSGAGGESGFRSSVGKAVHTPEHHRMVFRLHIPKKWAEKHMDHDLRGNLGSTRDKMMDRKHYDAHKGHDSEYYATSEVRFKKAIPPEFIHGYMKKKEASNAV